MIILKKMTQISRRLKLPRTTIPNQKILNPNEAIIIVEGGNLSRREIWVVFFKKSQLGLYVAVNDECSLV